MDKCYEFDALIKKDPQGDAAYVEIPFDVKAAFGKARVPVHAVVDGAACSGQLVKMGATGHIMGISKQIRARIGKQPGNSVHLLLRERTKPAPEITTVTEYIAAYEGDARRRMEKLRALIQGCSEQITEKIAWGMATFVLNGNLVHFAGARQHLGFYPGPSAIRAFADQLGAFKHSKGAVRFPYDQPLPYALIRDMVMFRVHEQTAGS